MNNKNFTNEKKINKNDFTVIKGGISNHFGEAEKQFINTFVTNTRLMGVVVICFDWKIDPASCPWASGDKFRQYFYMDFEESGMESYVGLSYADISELWFLDAKLIGGLGGRKFDLTLNEAKFLLQHYFEHSRKLNVPDPELSSEYSFLLDKPHDLSSEEIKRVLSLQCSDIPTPFFAINYFLMRSFGCDGDGADMTSTTPGLWKKIALPSTSTFNKNIIEIDTSADNTYICQSVIENSNNYYIIVSVIETTHTDASHKVSSVRKISQMRLSDAETAMQLNRPEYISVFPIELKDGFFDGLLAAFPDISPTAHFNGTMLMQYNETNNHAGSNPYFLGDDIAEIFFITDDNEFLIISHSKETVLKIEEELYSYDLRYNLGEPEGYVFNQSVFMDFLESGISGFGEFMAEYCPDDE